MDEIFFVYLKKIETAPRCVSKSPTYRRKDVTALQEYCDPQERLYTRVV